jgi:hypothetical protein
MILRNWRSASGGSVEESGEADDLRQNSPFAGALSEAERRRVLGEVR